MIVPSLILAWESCNTCDAADESAGVVVLNVTGGGVAVSWAKTPVIETATVMAVASAKPVFLKPVIFIASPFSLI